MNVFSSDFLFRNAVAGGLLITVLCAVLGIYVVLRRLSLLGLALPQASAAGIAFAFFATRHRHVGEGDAHGVALAGSLVFVFAGLLAVILGGRRSRFPAESRIAALFAASSALTFLFIALNPGGDFEVTSLLRGELLAISDADLVLLAVVSLVTAVLFFVFRREILLASFDPDFARSLGRDPWRFDALLYGLLGLAIGVGVMAVGPLVVFGFLTLPALGALSLAGGLGAAFAIAAGIAAVSSLGGFAIAYRADLPAGPVYVAVAALLWLGAAVIGRLRGGRHPIATGAAALALLVALGASLAGCAALRGDESGEAPPPLLERGSLPEPDPARPVAVLRIRNETGEKLRIPASNPVSELGHAVDPFAKTGATVPDLLERVAAYELSRRGFAVVAPEEVRERVPAAAPDAGAAAAAARRADLTGPVLYGTLRRFTPTQSHLLLVWLDLALVEPGDGRVIWSGSARRPVAVPAALTMNEIVIDAGPAIFADAFGPSR